MNFPKLPRSSLRKFSSRRPFRSAVSSTEPRRNPCLSPLPPPPLTSPPPPPCRAFRRVFADGEFSTFFAPPPPPLPFPPDSILSAVLSTEFPRESSAAAELGRRIAWKLAPPTPLKDVSPAPLGEEVVASDLPPFSPLGTLFPPLPWRLEAKISEARGREET